MKKLILLYFILNLLFFKETVSARFINGLEDIPIFKEMKYVEDSLVLFDKIDGRYVSSEIKGYYNKNEIIEFYNQILPNLGWQMSTNLIFKRGNEILEMSFSENSGMVSVIFSIYPIK
tara:strand:+ start:111 stop:464 length:354 start_codon:yes stop_codon:yes gene_type:complete